MLSVFPTGDYKMFLILTNENKESIMNITIIANFMSSNKDSFGWFLNSLERFKSVILDPILKL